MDGIADPADLFDTLDALEKLGLSALSVFFLLVVIRCFLKLYVIFRIEAPNGSRFA